MKISRLAILVLSICLLTAPLLAYELGGGAVSESECNDGIDNDGDGKIDENDPGCTRPYYADNSEGDIYDLDASWIFSGNSAPTSSGPSVFYGWETIEEGNDASPFKDSSGGSIDEIEEFYVEGSSEEWAGGEPKSVTINIPDAGTTDRDGNNRYELIDIPGENTDQQCGDGIQQSGEDQNNCPQDVHLPESSSVETLFEDRNTLRCESWDDGTGDYASGTTNYIVVSDDKAESSVPDFVPGGSYGGIGDMFDIASVYCTYPDSALKVAGTLDYKLNDGTTTSYDINHGTTSCSTDYDTSDSCDVTGTKCEITGSATKAIYSETVKQKSWTVNTKTLVGDYSGSGGSFSYWLDEELTTKEYDGSHEHWEYATSENFDYAYNCQSVSGGCSSGVNETCSDSVDDDSVSEEFTAVTSRSSHTATYYYQEPVESNSIVINDVNNRNGYTNDIEDSINIIDSRSDSSVKTSPGGYTYGGGDDSREMSNDMSASWTEMKAWGYPSSDEIRLHPNDWQVLDADGSDGQGSGYIAIDNGNIAGSTDQFLQTDIGYFVTQSDVPVPDCPGDSTKCVAAVDPYTTQSGWSKSSYNGIAEEFDFATGNPYSLDSSLGTCMMYKELTGDENVQCRYDGPGGGGTPTRNETKACGDQPYEHWVYMEGPEVDEDVMADYPAHYQKCIDTSKSDVTKSSCNLKGDTVPEGYVGNVAPDPKNSDAKYERGGNSPDWEVCLNIEDGSGDEVAGDNENDDINDEDYGGEWYDLDSENAQDYLRGSGLVSGPDDNPEHDIAYYWNDNINPPQDDEHNPQGGNAGTALEDDCGNPRFDSLRCDDQEDQKSRGYGDTDTFFSFFVEGHREEDFHPQGEDTDTGENPEGFTGVVNRMQERSDQLEPGMDTDAYPSSKYNIWEDTRGGEYADVWAISAYLNWSIDSTGTPYPPYSTWYRDASDQRTSPEDDSVDKMQKAFGNSYAAVATTDFTYTNENGETIDVHEGDGVWIDPDSMKTAEDVKLVPEGSSSEDPLWREALRRTDTRSGINNGFKIDLSGKDAGLGVDIADEDNAECLEGSGDGGCMVVANVTEWEKNDEENLESELEPPMCGDDRHEYFVEQAGEIDYSNRYIGPYACADSRNSCYDRDSPGEPSLVNQGEYRNVEEPEEDEGRLKNDAEFCQKVDNADHEDDFAVWYDQDYNKDFCRENILYGNDGVRWFDEEYVTDYPQAVKGGIDDSWNDYLEQHGHDSFESEIGNVEDGVTPVPTGDFNDKTATRGFCGGDDDGEYLVTQECNTRYCETDRTIQGVAKVPGSCVMRAEDSLYENGISERSIYKPGERVEITGVSGDPKVACFNGVWFGNWPISFYQDEVEVPVGSTKTAAFDVINTRNDEMTYKVTMEKDSASPSADQFARFTQHSGDSFTATVEGTSSKTFRIELTGGNENLDIGDPGSDLTVRADAINAGLVGSDSVAVGIEPHSNTGTGTSTGETRDVPGVQSLQLLVMMILSTLIYVRRRS